MAPRHFKCSSGRQQKVLSPKTKWEVLLQITSGEATQADPARKWGVDVSTIITIRRTVKEAALAALAAKPGRSGKERDWRLESAQAEIAQLPRRSSLKRSSWRSCGEKPAGGAPVAGQAAVLGHADRCGARGGTPCSA